MPNNRWGTALRGGIGAAGTGMGIAALAGSGPVGWAVGAGLGIASLYDAFTSKSPEDERSDRINKLIEQRQAARQQALARLATETDRQQGLINTTTTGRIKQGAADIGRRSASSGRSVDQADYLVNQNELANQGSDSSRNLTDASLRASNQINTEYDKMIADAQYMQADQPIQPSVTDYVGELGNAGMQFAQNRDLVNAMSTRTPGGGSTYAPGPAPLPGTVPENLTWGRTPVAPNYDNNVGDVRPVVNPGFDPNNFNPLDINTPGVNYGQPQTVPHGRKLNLNYRRN
jgi:hypothetical protein